MSINATDIIKLTEAATKDWTKQRKAEERGRRSRYSRQYMYSERVNHTDVADQILPGAYSHASGDGKYTVSKRQLYYACREQFREQTDRELSYDYFANTLLVQYMNRHPEVTGVWRVTADPRGTLTIANADHAVRVPCGTLAIEDHLRDARSEIDPFDFDTELGWRWPSLKAGQRYQGVLYIEKEGFEPVLNESRIAERFDLAILSCKGQSVVAARRFVDEVCGEDGGVPLMVVHDLDKAGFEIAQRLTTVSAWARENDRVTYRFRNKIKAVDLGLKLADVEEYHLQDEQCNFKGRFERNSIATDQEKEFLRSGRRVELNSFTSPQFIEWLESKLRQHLPERLIPENKILEDAYHRSLAIAQINSEVADIVAKAIEAANEKEIPADLRNRLKAAMIGDTQAWDEALHRLIEAENEWGC